MPLCRLCQQPVPEPSMGGPDLCPACDVGICRYCRVRMYVIGAHIDQGRSLRRWREHVASCHRRWVGLREKPRHVRPRKR